MPAPANIHEADFIRNHPEGVPRDPMFTVLRAYCLGLLKSCWYVTERIKFEHYYEVSFRIASQKTSAKLESGIDCHFIGGGFRHQYIP